MPVLIDLTGQRFGRLVVESSERVKKNGKSHVYWICQCDCGNRTKVKAIYLTRGETASCGCLSKEILTNRNKSHGLSDTRQYSIWKDMIKRCENPNHAAHRYYFDKGIKVCDEWRNDFRNFYDWSISAGYQEDLTIDRIDTNGNYEPSNCRWVSMKRQGNNKTNNRIIEFKGLRRTTAEWADITGIPSGTIRARIDKYKWSVEKALTTPVKKVI